MGGFDFPRGVAPERMPKADATGLAPEKSAFLEPPGLHRLRGFFDVGRPFVNPFLWWSLGAEALGILNAMTARRAFQIVFCLCLRPPPAG